MPERPPNPLVDLPAALVDTPLGRTDLARLARTLRWVALALGILAFASSFVVGARHPPDPKHAKCRNPGVDEAMHHIEPALATGAKPSDRCVALATTQTQILKGLMTRKDLAGYEAMAFAFANDSTILFYNRNVPIPLTVAWFRADGAYVGAKDLEPCPDIEGCPTIAAPTPYRYVLETKRGQMGDLGVGPGSTIRVTPGCG